MNYNKSMILFKNQRETDAKFNPNYRITIWIDNGKKQQFYYVSFIMNQMQKP